jgi:hypothetical protein
MKHLNFRIRQRLCLVISLACILPLLSSCLAPRTPESMDSDLPMPKPREVTKDERSQLKEFVWQHFKVRLPEQARYQAAGQYRFIATENVVYSDRIDTGSVLFEDSKYGISEKELDPELIARESLLPQIEAAMRGTGLSAEGRRFTNFQDEFVGTAEPQNLSSDFDPRRSSKRVARTASFHRMIQEVPVFGSELLVGLKSDGQLGRFRLHWPDIPADTVKEAQRLRQTVSQKQWTLPEILRSKDIEVLEITAGVGHSGFADHRFRSEAVVRVLYRKVSPNLEYPLSSTSYKYFDQAGREVRFSSFPQLPGTPGEKKKEMTKTEP